MFTENNAILDTEKSTQYVPGDSNFTTLHNNDIMILVNDNDIGIFVNAEKLYKDDIKNLLKNIWVPGEIYEFSWIYNNKEKHKLQLVWLERFTIL